jgi:hypothetical protein
MDIALSIVSENLKRFRGARTQTEMAEFFSVKYKRYQSLELGHAEPDIDFFQTAYTKGLSLNWLITGKGEMLLSPTECQECRTKERELLDLHRENKSLRNHEAGTEEKRLETLIEKCCDRVIDKLKIATPREAPLQQKKLVPERVDS